MLFDRIGQDRFADRHGPIRWKRKLAVEAQVEPQCRRVAARAAALGGMTGVALLVRRRPLIRSGVPVRCTIVLAVRVASGSRVRKTARHQLPEEQQDREAETGAATYHE